MKKALILSLSLILVVGVGALITKNARAQDPDPPVITSTYTTTIKEGEFVTTRVQWYTNEKANGKIEYGTASGNYTTTLDSERTEALDHAVTIQNLSYSTKYYFKVTVTDLAGNKTLSTENSFTTPEKGLKIKSIEVFDVGPNNALVMVETNKYSYLSVNYGSVSGTLPNVTGNVEASHGGDLIHKVWFKDLKPNTTYYYKIKAFIGQGAVPFPNEYYEIPADKEVNFEEKSFATTGVPKITSIDPDKGPASTEVTIKGENFGKGPVQGTTLSDRSHIVAVGCEPKGSLEGPTLCAADIISWSNSEIVVTTTSSAQTGKVSVKKEYYSSFQGLLMYSIEGPTFTALGGKPANVNAVPTTANYVTNAYGCDFSTSKSDENTIKVNTLFTKDSDTDKYLSQVYNLYQENWGRVPRCSEMQFHLDHSTPLDRLSEWLENQAITNKYGCDYSTTLSNENTVIVKTLFTLDSNIDKYLNQVYNAYFENWGRYPRCSEMQFHLDHSTPIDRLTKWLTENRPQVTNVNAAPTEVVTEKIEFKETDNKVVLKDETQKLKIEQDKQLTFTGTTIPNAFVTLTISSEPTIATTVSNDKGEWLYALPGPLEIGNHTIKIAVSDKYGKKVSESEIVKFSIVSGAKAVTPISITEFVKDNSITWLVCIVVVALIVIVIVYFLARKKPQTPAGPKK